MDHELLKKIIETKLPKEQPCFDARNDFVANFMMYGMNFTDMAFLKKKNIVDGRLQYRRRKTNKVFDIKMTPNLEQLFAHMPSEPPERLTCFRLSSIIVLPTSTRTSNGRENDTIKSKRTGERVRYRTNPG